MGISANKGILLAVLLILTFSVVYSQPVVEKTMPNTGKSGEPVQASVKILANTSFDLAELLPQDWKILSWSVSGNTTPIMFEYTTDVYRNQTKELYHWNFGVLTENEIILSYTFVPKNTADKAIISLWTYPGGFDSKTNEFALKSASSQLPAINLVFLKDIAINKIASIIVIILIIATAVLVYNTMRKYKRLTPHQTPSMLPKQQHEPKRPEQKNIDTIRRKLKQMKEQLK